MNNRTYSTPKGQTVKNDSAVTQAAKTETNVKYVGLQKPNDVNIELENRLQEIEMKTEELINIYNGGINVSTNGQTSVVNEYGADRETDTDENEAVSNVKVYGKKLYRGSKNETTKEENIPLVSKELIKMRPTLPYYYHYETSCTEICTEMDGTTATGGTGTMYLDFNTYAYPAKLSVSRAKYCQAMIVGCGKITVSNVYDLHKMAFPFPNIFGAPISGEIDPEDPDSYNPIRAYSTGTVSILDYETNQSTEVYLYDELGYEVLVDLGPHFDQLSYYPGGRFGFPQSTHLKTSKITGDLEFTFIIQGHVTESAFRTYGWDNCTVLDDRESPMGG